MPATTLEAGVSYILANEALYREDVDGYAEATWSLASMKNEQAAEWWKRIDPNSLSPHGYISYAYAAHELGRYTPQIATNLDKIMNTPRTESYWYWNA